MKHHSLGSGAPDVTAIALGTATLGAGIEVEDGWRMMDAYLDMGGNHIDTARVYSDWVPGEAGRSERIIGDWMAARHNRSRVVIATKGAHPRLDSMHTPRLSRADVGGDLELSLKALRTDVIDLYYLHRDDRSQSVGEILEMLEGFVRAGKIRRYACSNWRADRMLEAHAYAVAHGLQGFAANQVFWSLGSTHSQGLADDTCEAFDGAMRGAFLATGMIAAAYTSQANGYFTKLDQGGDVSGSLFDTPGNRLVYEKAKAVAGDAGMSVTDVVLQYILCQPFPSVAVVGCRTETQLRETMASADKTLTPGQIAMLESVD